MREANAGTRYVSAAATRRLAARADKTSRAWERADVCVRGSRALGTATPRLGDQQSRSSGATVPRAPCVPSECVPQPRQRPDLRAACPADQRRRRSSSSAPARPRARFRRSYRYGRGRAARSDVRASPDPRPPASVWLRKPQRRGGRRATLLASAAPRLLRSSSGPRSAALARASDALGAQCSLLGPPLRRVKMCIECVRSLCLHLCLFTFPPRIPAFKLLIE